MLLQHAQENNLRTILQIQYQFRTPLEHQYLINIFTSSGEPNMNIEKAKLYQYFAKLIKAPDQLEQNPQDIYSNSILYVKDGVYNRYLYKKLQTKMTMTDICKYQGLFIQANDVDKCQILGWRSPEFQIKFLHECSILAEINKKKLSPILRNSKVFQFRSGQILYNKNSQIINGYFIVRSGQFCLLQKERSTRKNVELLSFHTGYLFRQYGYSLQLDGHNQLQNGNFTQPYYNYTIKCKSSKGVLYCIDKQFFNSNLLQHGQNKFKKHFANQLSFLEHRIKLVQSKRSSTAHLLSQIPKRIESAQLLPFTAPIRSFSRQSPSQNQEVVILDLLQKPSDYRIVKQSMPKRNRLYSKSELKQLYPNPQEDESDSLIWRKAKCMRLKQMTKTNIKIPTRGQILFAFTQSAVKFEKHKRKISIL